MTDNAKIINQLRALVLLTQTEEQVARTRISQARTEAVRRELTQNADNAAERTRVITAHQATVEWLTVVLAEEAMGGPAALQATALQRVAGTAARAANAPVRFWANRVNEVVESVHQRREQAGEP